MDNERIDNVMLGDVVEDIYSGFTGVATTKMTFINDCVQFEVVPKVGKDNKPVEGTFIDIQSLRLVKKGKKHLDYEKELRKKVIEDKKTKREEKDEPPGGPNHKSLNITGHYNRRKV